MFEENVNLDSSDQQLMEEGINAAFSGNIFTFLGSPQQLMKNHTCSNPPTFLCFLGDECANVDERETSDAEEFDRDLFEQELLNEEEVS